MKPINHGGHLAYQNHVLEQLRKYYPSATTSLPTSTLDIIERFLALDLSPKGRTKFKCPKISFAGGSITCTCDYPCSDAKYGRTVHLVIKDNPRLFNDPPRSSKEWKDEYKARPSSERCSKGSSGQCH